jgi:anaerobic magnesium-protoporphyrin IX monomethyl ester cyclase
VEIQELTKIVLVHPPSDPLCHEAVFGLKAPPLGLAYIAAYLEERQFRPDIIDMSVEGMSIEEFRSRLHAAQPDIVGVYCSITRVKQSLQVAQIAKSLGARVVFGGPHATFDYENLIRNENVDVIIRGEGEQVFARLAESFEAKTSLEGLKGVVFKESGGIRVSPEASLIEDLDSLPFPAFHLLPMKSYRICDRISICTLSSSRGCSRKCRYCVVPSMYQGRWRPKTPTRVVDEMENILSTYKPSLLLFFDEFFTEDLKRVEFIMDEIIHRGVNVRWACMSTGTDISRELMIKMRKAGCLALFFGVECGVITSIPDLEGWRYAKQVEEAFTNAHEAGIFPIANAVFGFPGETRADFDELVRWVIELDPDHALFFKATPYSDFEEDELDGMERSAYRQFYGRRSYPVKHIARAILRTAKYRQLSMDLIVNYSKWLTATLRKVNRFQDHVTYL